MANHPPQAEIHRLMADASAAYAQGDVRRAGAGATRVLQQAPEMPEAMHLLGLCFLREGDAGRAVQLLRHAAALRPADAMLVHHLGIALQDAGDLAGALAVLERAAALDPRDVDIRLNIGVVSEKAGDTASAEQAYRDVLEREPRHAAAAAYLSSILEQRNSLEDAAVLSDRALEIEPREPVANLTRAQLDLRTGRMSEAAARLQDLLADPALSPRNRAVAAGRLGAAYDRLGEPEAAWRQFMAAKTALQGTFAPQAEGMYGLSAATRMRRYLDRLPDGSPSIQGTMPVFLVGFPRSGTTLLDQILSGHPGIEVLEEKATLLDFLSEFTADDAALERLTRVVDAELEPWRRRYWQRVQSFMPTRDPQRLFVDKMPLNSLYMPLIHRLFPGARYLFALRDPRDVVLSCCMQTFTLNEAMRHFQSLDETARYYAAVMDVGAASAARLQGQVHRIRYEDVVADTEGAARRLLEFLGLPWDSSVLDFQRTARAKRISTPSYHQVVEPIYTRARERWRRYENQLAPVLPLLQPFVERFGYR